MSFKEFLKEKLNETKPTEAYRKGYASGNGSHGPKEKSDNPYKKGTPEFKEWIDGYDEGKYGAGGGN